jgi:MFS family permease
VSVVLPFIAAEFDLLWVAGLLYAAYSVGIVAGNSVSPYVLQRAGHKKHFLIAGSTAIMAVFVLIAGISARSGILVAVVFLTVSLTVGLVSGVSKVAFSEVISSKLSESRRRDLVLIQ